jgi:acetyl esterase/lipase
MQGSIFARSCGRLVVLGAILLGPQLVYAAEPPAKPATPSTAPAAAEGKRFVYKKTLKGDLEIEVFFPPGWTAADQRPAIVFFFGGGWTHGNRSQFATQSRYLASRGMVAATADYRIKSKHQATPEQSVEDAKSAVRWMRSKAGELGIDPHRLAAGGGSAGGHLAASTALCPGLDAKGEDVSISSRPDALVLFNPVVDMTQVTSYLAGTPEERQEMAKKISPIAYLTKDAPPAVMFFGTSDRLSTQGKAYLEKATTAGAKAELYLADNQPHGFFNRAPWQESTLRQADQFLTSIGYLKGEPTLPAPEAKGTLKKAATEK